VLLNEIEPLARADQRSGDIANRLGVKVTCLGPVRSKLIKKTAIGVLGR
jgi:hypothetical protein